MKKRHVIGLFCMSLMCMGVSCETTQKIDKNNGTSSADVSNSVREQKEQTTEITQI